MSNIKIQELFALPIGLRKVITIYDVEFYGSDTLNEKLIESIKSSKNGKFILKLSERLIKNKIMIPCFISKGMLSYFKRKISKIRSGQRILRVLDIEEKTRYDEYYAFFHVDGKENLKKLIILIDNMKLNSNNDKLVSIIIHELVHMFSYQNPNEFLTIFEDELTIFYKEYFKRIFKLEDSKKLNSVIQSFYKTIYRIESQKDLTTKMIISKFEKIKPFSKMNSEEFYDLCKRYIELTIIIHGGGNPYKNKYYELIENLGETYKTCFGKKPVGYCQEVIYISEVICVLSSIKFSSKIKNAIQLL